MNTLRDQLITEIQYIPDSHLQEIFSVVHFFRLGLTKLRLKEKSDIQQFAGAWTDMDDNIFTTWDTEWRERRRTRF